MTMKKALFLAATLFLSIPYASATLDVRAFGAKGDGTTLDTHAIQAAIDSASACGGETVVLTPGRYLSGTLVLKSNVTLHIERGATLLGSTQLSDYPSHESSYVSHIKRYSSRSLIFADKVENITICGQGTIDGQGSLKNYPATETETLMGITRRPYLLRVISCKNVTLSDIHLRNSPAWTQHYLDCENVFIDGIDVYNHGNYNNDGIDIVDCNAGNHGMAFATNFNPEINIREVTQKGRYYENGEWVVTEPHEIHKPLNYPGIGERESYVIYHEELESLVKNYPTIRRARFWMTFGQEYLTHLRVIQNIGMARIDPIIYNGVEIVPIQFLKAVLPDPKSLGANYHGQTSIGCRIKGLKDGKERTYYIYNNCDHEQAFKETGTQAVSFTTGVPAALGASMWAKGLWRGAGVFNVEEFDPDPFLAELGEQGLPWHELFDVNLEV